MNGKEWTEEDDAIIRDGYEKGIPVADIVAMLPGRTSDSLRSHAKRIGIHHASFRPWTAEEDQIIREIWKDQRIIKEGLHRLPGRSYDAAKSRATRLGVGFKVPAKKGTKSYALRTMLTLLKGVSMTAKEIAAVTGMDEGHICDVLKRWRGVEFRICAWERVDRHHIAMKWTAEAGEDVPKPAPKTIREMHKSYRARKKIEKGAFNPFAAAAGLIEAPKAPAGRIYKQSMEVRELEEA